MIQRKLGYEALLAILLGIFAGLFFGPLCADLKPIGDAFIYALQIIVLPFIPSLLMHGLGSLSPDLAKKLFKRGWFVLILMWIVILGVCYIVKELIPTPLPSPSVGFTLEQTAAPFNASSSDVKTTNIFDVANNIIPIVTIFSLIFGVALMHLKDKEPLLGLLDRINNSLDRVIKWITVISPIGIFAHVAYVMGTINFHDLAKLQLYVGIVIFTTLFLSLWVFPMLVSNLTSIPFRELMREYRNVSFLPFATAIPTIALPYINNAMRRMAERKNLELATFKNTSQTMMPIGFGFAQLGNFIPLLFIFFLSFFFRHPLEGSEKLLLPFLVTIFSIGIPQFSFVALPFLLKTLTLPAEGFSLYAEISAITLNFQVLLSTVSMLSFIYLVVLRYYGLLEIQWRRLCLTLGSSIIALVAIVFAAKNYIPATDNYNDLYYSLKVSDIIESPPPVTIYKERAPMPAPTENPTLARILKRGVIRVCYDERNIPFCYLNKWDEVVGYDIAYAYQLAKDLDVKLELVPLVDGDFSNAINSGYADTIMSAVLLDEKRILTMLFSDAYNEQENVLVVPRAREHEFINLPLLQSNPNLKIAATGGYTHVVTTHFSEKNLVLANGIDLLVNGQVDAQLWSELPAYIWCLAHPDFITISYQNALGKKYFAYPVRPDSEQFVHFINEWLSLKQEQGFEEKQRQYWFLGKTPISEEKRWSIIRNVLHWID